MSEEMLEKCAGSPDHYALGRKCLDDGDIEAAIAHFNSGADENDPDALCALGVCYVDGNGVRQDYARAARFLEKAAEYGNAEATYLMGVLYADGKGVAKDADKSLEYYRAAAKEGCVEAIYAVGKYHLDALTRGLPRECMTEAAAAEFTNNNVKLAFDYFSRAAEKDYAPAVYMLGECCRYGRGTAQDEYRALEYYERAAALGSAPAQYLLGRRCERGDGVTRDYAKAVEWYVKAAENGSEAARTALDACYKAGRGVPKRYAEALGGDRDAQFAVAEAYYNGDKVARDYVEAYKWYETAADSGHLEARLKVGECLLFGKGTIKSADFALPIFHEILLAGAVKRDEKTQKLVARAEYYLGYMLYFDLFESGKTDMDRALEYLKESAAGGDADATFLLAEYYDKAGGFFDRRKAVGYYKKAAQAGNVEAMYALGSKHGQRVWLDAAADRGHVKAMLDLAAIYKEERDYPHMAFMIKLAAENGNADAQYKYATFAANGSFDVKKDARTAFKWYSKAAANGHEKAKEELKKLS